MDYYRQAASTLEGLDARKGSLPALATDISKRNASRIIALVANTLAYRSFLSRLLDSPALDRSPKPIANLRKMQYQEPKCSSDTLLLVLLYDLVFGSRGIVLPAEHPLRKALSSQLVRLKAEKEKEKVRRGVSSDEALAKHSQTSLSIRWLRVNTLKWSTEQAETYLLSHSWICVDSALKIAQSEEEKLFVKDSLVPDLFGFPRNVLKMKAFEPYLDGRMISQDKASCFPPLALLDSVTSSSGPIYSIDATAAPGNKTTLLASLLWSQNQSSTVTAFEKDKKRFQTLAENCNKTGCENVYLQNADFLSISPDALAYRNVTHILVDPSCSGSGISERVDSGPEGGEENVDRRGEIKARLEALARFQVMILSHALRFPAVEKVVYSTCSIYENENEKVIKSILDKTEFQKAGWKLGGILPDWNRRGVENSGIDHQMVVRCKPGDEDFTNGFFVASLVRTKKPIIKKTDGERKPLESESSTLPSSSNKRRVSFSEPTVHYYRPKRPKKYRREWIRWRVAPIEN